MASWIANILGGDVVKGVSDLIGNFVTTPEQKTALAEATLTMQQHAADLQAEQQKALVAYKTQALEEQGLNLRADSSSKDAFVRRARPAFLWVMTLALGFNLFLPLVSQLFGGHLQPLPIADGLYSLFGAAFLGYTGARTWEKTKGTD